MVINGLEKKIYSVYGMEFKELNNFKIRIDIYGNNTTLKDVKEIKEYDYKIIEEYKDTINYTNVTTGENGIMDRKVIYIELTEKKEIKTYNELIKEIKKELSSYEDNEIDYENNNIFEFLHDTFLLIEKFAKRYTISNNEYYKLISLYSRYDYCNSKDKLKLNILMDAIDNTICGKKSSFTSVKKEALKELKELNN